MTLIKIKSIFRRLLSPNSVDPKPKRKGIYTLKKTKLKNSTKPTTKIPKTKAKTSEIMVKQSRISLYPSKIGRVNTI